MSLKYANLPLIRQWRPRCLPHMCDLRLLDLSTNINVAFFWRPKNWINRPSRQCADSFFSDIFAVVETKSYLSRRSGRGTSPQRASKADSWRITLQPVTLYTNQLGGVYPEARIEVGHLAGGGSIRRTGR